jgi:acylphosphatase
VAELAALKVVVTGRVQGIMFRDFTRHHAEALGLKGYVKNLPGGRGVELEAEGEREKLEALLELVKKGPPRASVENTSQIWSTYSGKYSDFKILF